MKAFNQFIVTLLAVAVLAAIGFAAWLGLEQVVAVFASLDAAVARVTAIASAVVLLSAMLIAAALRQAGRDRLAVPLREEKASTYRLFTDCWRRRLASGDAPPAALNDELQTMDHLLALCGSPSVIAANVSLRELVRSGGARAESQAMFRAALLQIRKELKSEDLTADALNELLAAPVADGDARAPVPGSLSPV